MRFLDKLLKAGNPDNVPGVTYSLWDSIAKNIKENKYLLIFLGSVVVTIIAFLLIRKYLKKLNKDENEENKDEK